MILHLCADCGVAYVKAPADVANRCVPCAGKREAWAVALAARLAAAARLT
jgi:hypothetical protein